MNFIDGVDPIAESPFCSDLGVRTLEWAGGRAVIEVEIAPRLMNRRGAAHGGVIATLADQVLSMAWRSAAPERATVGTVTLNVHFIGAGTGLLRAQGTLVKLTGTLAFCEGRVTRSDGELVATAQATFRTRTIKA